METDEYVPKSRKQQRVNPCKGLDVVKYPVSKLAPARGFKP